MNEKNPSEIDNFTLEFLDTHAMCQLANLQYHNHHDTALSRVLTMQPLAHSWVINELSSYAVFNESILEGITRAILSILGSLCENTG